MERQITLDFIGISPEKLRKSLETKTPIEYNAKYLGCIDLSLLLTVTKLEDKGNLIFEAEVLHKGKVWICGGYVAPSTIKAYKGFCGQITYSFLKKT